MLEVDVRALALVVLVALLFLLLFAVLRKSREVTCFDFSDQTLFPEIHRSWRQRFVHLPQILWRLSFLCLIIAFIDPRIERELPKDQVLNEPSRDKASDEIKHEELSLPTEGVAIYLVLDQSGSMSQEMNFVNSEGKQRFIPRMDVLKQVTGQFVKGSSELGLKGRRDDLIGLVAFARVPQVLVPLTLDHAVILEHLVKMKPIEDEKGNGTAIGYALFKTINLIKALHYFANKLPESGKPAYDIKSTVIVLVTDGIQEPNPSDKGHSLRSMDLNTASVGAIEEGIRVYVVNLNSEIAHPYYEQALIDLQNVAKQTGGKFYLADQPEALGKIYADIDLVEKAFFIQQKKVNAEVHEKVEQNAPRRLQWVLFPYLTALGAALLCLSTILSCTLLRRVP